MTTNAKNEFQLSATPGEDLSRRLAYLATQGNDSVMTGGFAKAPGLEGADDDKARSRQGISTMELLAQQEQIRQDQIARLSSQFDALEIAARDALFDAENNLATILSNANRATDGRAVFKDKDGNIRDEDGQIVDESAVDMSEWEPDGPAWERFENALSAVERRTEFYERVSSARDGLDSERLDRDALSGLEDELAALEAEFIEMDTPAESTSEQPEQSEPTVAQPAGQTVVNDALSMKPL